MSNYNYTVAVSVAPANGQGTVPADIEAAILAEFVKRVRNLGVEFGIGVLTVTVTLVP